MFASGSHLLTQYLKTDLVIIIIIIVPFTDGSTVIDIDMVFIPAADCHIIHPRSLTIPLLFISLRAENYCKMKFKQKDCQRLSRRRLQDTLHCNRNS